MKNKLHIKGTKSKRGAVLFRNSPRSASPHDQLLPFPHFVTAGRAVVKRFSAFGVEVRFPPAFVTAALKSHPTTPDRQISTFVNTPPESSCSFVAACQTPFAGWLAWFNQPSDLFATRQQFPSIRGLAIHETLSGNHRHKSRHPFPVCVFAGVPTKFKLAGVFGKMLGRNAMPRTEHATL